MPKKQLSYTSAVSVAALPTATAALKGVTVWLTTDDKPYWCDGTQWIDLSAGGAGGGSVVIQDEGVQKTSAVSLINFTGAGVTVSNTGNAVAVQIDNPQVASGLVGRSGAVATTSGSAKQFAIPAWATRVTMMLDSVSEAGGANLQVKLGTSAGIDSTGYAGVIGGTQSTTSFIIPSANAANIWYGSLVLNLVDAATNKWAIEVNVGNTGGGTVTSGGGTKSLSGILTTVELSTSSTFDLGNASVTYEGVSGQSPYLGLIAGAFGGSVPFL